ncbi:hypothetical protein CHS0354_001987 [Potamilus streckersoni]|uniref:Excinuclease ABC subunit C n=1 Tax=Potamilus streckersoni TaxID=2493646 RepID=A0AAE0T5K9_9BIVA|nr:hypothetical protein CHS0354_001987 [Potamilus streckersoni]
MNEHTDKDISGFNVADVSLKEKLHTAPDKPGVYFWKDKHGKILYIGKAKILRNRVRSYFNTDNDGRGYRIELMMSLVADLDWVITSNESEALILEDHLIKTHKPKFNIRQKDNKSYPYLKLTKELYPRLYLTRNLEDKAAHYFGPYKSAFDAKKTLAIIHKYFPLRKKNLTLDGNKTYRPCLNFHIGRCLAPCTGKVDKTAYEEITANVTRLLKGDYRSLVSLLEQKMQRQSDALEFEEAAKIRDQIRAVNYTLKKQRVVYASKISRDAVYIHENMGMTAVQFLFVRNGIILSGDFFTFKNNGSLSVNEIMRFLVSKIYIGGKTLLPEELIVSHDLESFDMLAEYAAERKQTPLKIFRPERGERRELLELCMENARQNLLLHTQKKETDEYILMQAKQELHLRNIPNNRPLKDDYRRFKIKTVEGSNDFMAMAEVITRRMKRRDTDNWTLPDLMVIDGGVGQLSAVMQALKDFDTEEMDVIAIAKGRTEKRSQPGGRQDEPYDTDYVIKPGQKNTIPLKKNSPAAHMIRNVRDEAHRFALSYHRTVRSSASLATLLTQIEGIGKIKQQRLLTHFGSLTRLRDANPEEITSLKGLNSKDSEKIRMFFDRQTEK